LWSTLSVSDEGNTYTSIYRNDNPQTFYVPAPVTPPFFTLPKNPDVVLFSSTTNSILQFSSGAIKKINGRLSEFIQSSDCAADCSLNGNCISGKCTCFVNYFGATCAQLCTRNDTCSNHGQCNATGGCVCDPNWIGKNCDKVDIKPPVFPDALTVFSVKDSDSVYNFFYDFYAQKQKFQYNSMNVTQLYDIGFSYNITGTSCTSTLLTTVKLDRWCVSPNAQFIDSGISCLGNDPCSLWQLSTTQWLVNSKNLPVKITNATHVISFDPSKFVIGQPDPSTWGIPAEC